MLWVDDEGPHKFRHTARIIGENGWTIEWADCVTSAVDRLANETYDDLLVDQMLPFNEDDEPDVWNGCILIRWLRGMRPPPGTSGNVDRDQLMRQSPLPENAKLRAIIVSAYNEADVRKATEETEGEIVFKIKPVTVNELLKLLKQTRSKKKK